MIFRHLSNAFNTTSSMSCKPKLLEVFSRSEESPCGIIENIAKCKKYIKYSFFIAFGYALKIYRSERFSERYFFNNMEIKNDVY